MQDLNLKYLNDGFLTLDEVSRKSGVPAREIEDRIRDRNLPEPSYRLRSRSVITSALDDEHIIEEERSYFPLNYPDLVVERQDGDANEIKDDFIGKMKEHLLSHPGKEFAFGGIVAEAATLDAELEAEWNHYCAGIYGICTLEAAAPDIIDKEIAVKKIISFLEAHEDGELSENQKESLFQMIEAYDKVSNLFAPYQRVTSSRGKYIDKALRSLGKEDLIKQYK